MRWRSERLWITTTVIAKPNMQTHGLNPTDSPQPISKVPSRWKGTLDTGRSHFQIQWSEFLISDGRPDMGKPAEKIFWDNHTGEDNPTEEPPEQRSVVGSFKAFPAVPTYQFSTIGRPPYALRVAFNGLKCASECFGLIFGVAPCRSRYLTCVLNCITEILRLFSTIFFGVFHGPRCSCRKSSYR